MSLILDGTSGLSDVDGTAATPAIRGTDTNTGIFFPAADTIAFSEGGVEVARFDSAGSLGVGTTSPSSFNGARLISVGDVAAVVTGESWYRAYSTSAATDKKIWRFGNIGNGDFAFQTVNDAYSSATERMRIDSSGNLLVGQTATINSERLCVRQSSSANTTGIVVGYGTAAGEFRSMSIISTNAMTFNNGSNEAQLSSAGAWVNASDARLKNSIVDIKYGLETVLNTQPRSYKMNDLEGDYIGFVAQELQTVIPEVVSGNPETQLGVDYGSLVAVAFKAIQELKATVDAQAARIAALENPPAPTPVES